MTDICSFCWIWSLLWFSRMFLWITSPLHPFPFPKPSETFWRWSVTVSLLPNINSENKRWKPLLCPELPQHLWQEKSPCRYNYEFWTPHKSTLRICAKRCLFQTHHAFWHVAEQTLFFIFHYWLACTAGKIGTIRLGKTNIHEVASCGKPFSQAVLSSVFNLDENICLLKTLFLIF